MLPKVIIGVVVLLIGFFVVGSYLKGNKPDFSQGQNQQEQPSSSSTSYQTDKTFYNKDGISLTHSWPGENNFSNEETEVLLFNESDSSVEVKSFDLTYSIGGKTYPHKSDTWEKFSTKTSWDKIEYINISPQYYKGEPLILTPGQKGKLHWHIQFGNQPLNGKQTVTVKLTLLKGNKTINIDEQFNRDSGTVFSKGDH